MPPHEELSYFGRILTRILFWKRWRSLIITFILVLGFTQMGVLLLFLPKFTGPPNVPKERVSNQPPKTEPSDVRLIYRAEFGLGHRLSKLAAAHDLARRFGIGELEVDFGICDDQKIFRSLFGEEVLALPGTRGKDQKHVIIRNDVKGYYAGQNFKNAQIPIDKKLLQLWYNKMESDHVLFERLRQSFQFTREIQDFQTKHSWHERHVIGLHLRVGNGEQEHFVEAGRNVSATELAQSVVSLIRENLLPTRREPLLFVATDTPSLLPIIQDAFGSLFKVVSFPQPRVKEGQGVSYSVWTSGRECLEGWKASAIDMLLLAQSHTIVAATRSTFTQILPLSLVLKKGGQFCQLEGDKLACFRDMRSWLFHGDSGADSGSIHKIMVHFPDDEAHDELLSFLSSDRDFRLRYGRRFDPKYREFTGFRSDFNLQEIV